MNSHPPFLRCTRRSLLAWPLLALAGLSSARAAAAGDRGLVYQCTKDSTTFWLGGSLHRLRRQDHPLPDPYLTAWRQAERVVFEVPPGELASPWFRRKLSELRTLPDKTTLEAEMPPALWKATSAAATRLGVPLGELQAMRPWFAAWRLSEKAWETRKILTYWGMEETFSRMAAREAKPCTGLEKASVLLERLKDVSRDPDEQLRTLAGTLQSEKNLATEFETLRRAWRAGDEAALTDLFRGAAPADSPLQEDMMTGRNRAWVKRIDRSPRDFQKALVLPGIGHLPGPDGMAAGLRAKGWVVTRM